MNKNDVHEVKGGTVNCLFYTCTGLKDTFIKNPIAIIINLGGPVWKNVIIKFHLYDLPYLAPYLQAIFTSS